MRLGWLLLLFPSAAFAIAGCPVGVQLGNVTMATPLPVCLKFEGSQLGGCLVACNGVCVELPLANTKGPVETTGTACSITENGSGNGDSDGSGNTPDEGPSGTKPIAGWLDFEPVIGDATGTSVSGAVAKLNKNLGVALRQVVEGSKQDSGNLNSIAHSAESFSRDMKTALYHLERTANETFYSKSTLMDIMGRINTSNDYLEKISKLDSSSGAASGAAGTGGNLSKEFEDKLFGTLDSMRYGSLNNIDFKMSDVKGHLAAIEGALGRNGMAGNVYAIRQLMEQMSSGSSGGGSMGGGSTGGSTGSPNQEQLFNMLEAINDNISRTGGTTANNSGDLLQAFYELQRQLASGEAGGGSGGDGSSIDYSKLPGSGDNPLSVKEAKYSSACSGNDCFFDVAAIQKKLDEANKAISDKYKDIGDEVRDIFDFQLSGSAGVIECFDFFTYGGKDYRVCPPAKEYWNIIAALMMFIFYFIAFAIVFKR
ncbi:hypothetical protein [Aeromonas sp. FDAARGOS 1416]|uniref:hypothetical protein n=1 Tax=Aeromonas TaxID=642 RepID=UPI001C2272D5|nr:hypothetical protein [Aeromonas sp. FDAARGOS 1416]QXB02996.1 hypothetical protein I6L46_06465 [Aeromonas sp. FDAARGOS 1416]